MKRVLRPFLLSLQRFKFDFIFHSLREPDKMQTAFRAEETKIKFLFNFANLQSGGSEFKREEAPVERSGYSL